VRHLDNLADRSKCGFCKGCFTGEYPVAPPKFPAKDKYEQKLGENC
jgi:amidophosphoribosyltransferase